MANRFHGMVSRQPARRWQDALPTGNGSVGAMVYGHIRNELILLNHDQLWLRTPKPTVPDVSEHLPALRALLDQGRYEEATLFLDARLREAGYPLGRVDPYHPAGDLAIEMDTQAAFTRYRRALDFATAEASVSWREGERDYRRATIVSRADDVVATRIACTEPGAVSCRLQLIPHGSNLAPQMGAWRQEHPGGIPIAFAASAALDEASPADGWLTLTGTYSDGGQFGAVARVAAKGGAARLEGERIGVEGADEALVLVGLFANEPSGPALARLRDRLAALPADYDALLARHAALHAPLFARAMLDLGAPEAEVARCNEELLLDGYDGDVPAALIERLIAYGRYLLICSSAPGSLPANLQGVWNGDYNPAWASDYHNDENIQMNYWAALPGNLAETALPYFDYYDEFLEDNRINARRLYGCRGILVPISQSTHGLLHYGPWLNWTAGAGWLAQLYVDYYLYTGDTAFLRQRAVPFMKEVALFYEDFLFEGPDGKLMVSPSLSPENRPAIPGGSLCTVNATMDIAIAKELLTNLCEACEALGVEAEGVARWRAVLNKLPDYQVNADGAIKEWIHPGLPDNYHHRHQSHIYPVFPGREVMAETHPKLFEACRVAVEKRLVVGLNSQTGWSFAHMANIYARLGQGDRALQCLELIARACLGPNLLTYHNDWRGMGLTLGRGPGTDPIFQIDANFGVAAAALEMLLFSAPGWIKLLPALPAKWAKGEVTGLRARGGLTVSIRWDMAARSVRAELVADRAQTVTVRFPAPLASLAHNLPAEAVSPSEYGEAYRRVALPAGQMARLEAILA
mgnify:CR=1 FL=1